MNKILSFIIIALFIFTPVYINAAITTEGITEENYHQLEFYGVTTNILEDMSEPTDIIYSYQVGDQEIRNIIYDDEGNYTSKYTFEGDSFLITLNSEDDFTITYNGLPVTTSQGDYESELDVKESTIYNVENVLKTVQEPSYTEVNYVNGIYNFETNVDEYVIQGSLNIDENTFSYTSTLSSKEPTTVTISY